MQTGSSHDAAALPGALWQRTCARVCTRTWIQARPGDAAPNGCVWAQPLVGIAISYVSHLAAVRCALDPQHVAWGGGARLAPPNDDHHQRRGHDGYQPQGAADNEGGASRRGAAVLLGRWRAGAGRGLRVHIQPGRVRWNCNNNCWECWEMAQQEQCVHHRQRGGQEADLCVARGCSCLPPQSPQAHKDAPNLAATAI